MTTLNISLPDAMKSFIEAQVHKRMYASASDYIRALVREDEKRQAEQELEAKLLAALESDDYREAAPDLFERLRARVHAQRLT